VLAASQKHPNSVRIIDGATAILHGRRLLGS